MATIVVEDGSGLTTSNSYISAADLDTYASDRGKTISGTQADLLIQAMDYIESFNFKGDKYTDEQALLWPRTGVYLDGYYVTESTIPQLLIDATAEVAISIDAGTNPLSNESRESKREKVGDIEVEYSSGARTSTYLKAAETKLQKLLKSAGATVAIRG